MTAEGSLGGVEVRPDRTEDEAAAYRRFEGRFVLFGTLATYAAAGVGLLDTVASRPAALGGGSGVAIIGLLIAFFLFYHLVFLRGPDPPSLRRVGGYGAAQALLVVALQRLAPSLGNLAIPLAVQVMGLVPARLWPVPIVGVLATATVGWDLVGELRRGNAAVVALVGYQLLLWVAVFGFVLVLLRQRLRLAELVGELRRAEEALRQSAAEAEELATLRERARLAREMHDGLGHALVTVNVKLEAAERLYARDPARGGAELRQTRGLVREAMVGLRRSLDDLRAPPVAAPDLPAALRTLLAETRERTGLTIVDEIDVEAATAPPAVSGAAWWLAREALRNAERHAAAASVVLSLERRDGALVLRVADDGSGIAAGDPKRPGRYGITGMRERATAIGGSLRIGPRPGGGTSVEAILPLAATGAAAVPGTASTDPAGDPPSGLDAHERR